MQCDCYVEESKMKVRATIDIEFEMTEGQPENAAEAALLRGLGDLRRGIEFGAGTGMSTGVKRASVRADIVQKAIT
jgi:hypothetical protein